MKDGRSMKKRYRKEIGLAKVRQSMEKGKITMQLMQLLSILRTKKLQSKC